jgi:hypothetical protein
MGRCPNPQSLIYLYIKSNQKRSSLQIILGLLFISLPAPVSPHIAFGKLLKKSKKQLWI